MDKLYSSKKNVESVLLKLNRRYYNKFINNYKSVITKCNSKKSGKAPTYDYNTNSIDYIEGQNVESQLFHLAMANLEAQEFEVDGEKYICKVGTSIEKVNDKYRRGAGFLQGVDNYLSNMANSENEMLFQGIVVKSLVNIYGNELLNCFFDNDYNGFYSNSYFLKIAKELDNYSYAIKGLKMVTFLDEPDGKSCEELFNVLRAINQLVIYVYDSIIKIIKLLKECYDYNEEDINFLRFEIYEYLNSSNFGVIKMLLDHDPNLNIQGQIESILNYKKKEL